MYIAVGLRGRNLLCEQKMSEGAIKTTHTTDGMDAVNKDLLGLILIEQQGPQCFLHPSAVGLTSALGEKSCSKILIFDEILIYIYLQNQLDQ